MSAAVPRQHLDDEGLERYATGKAIEAEIAEVEEHLLICESCRRDLDRTEAYLKGIVRAARACRRLEVKPEPKFFAMPQWLGWALAAGLALVGGLYWMRVAPHASAMPATVVLEAMRGPISQAPANAPLVLRPDLAGLPAADAYVLEVVGDRGAPVWEGKLAAPAAQVVVPKQRPGLYFVRIYTPQRSLLREFGLNLTNN